MIRRSLRLASRSILQAGASRSAMSQYRRIQSGSVLNKEMGFGMGIRFMSSLPAHIKLSMPALSPTMSEGTLAKWRKQEGDAVNPGDVLAEVETDKATVDFESVEEGFLAKILVKEGAGIIPVGKLVAILCENEADIAAFKDFTEDAEVPAEKTAQKEEKVEVAPKVESVQNSQQVPSAVPEGRVFATPLAKTLAAEKGIEIASVRGTGPSGRVIAADVREYVPLVAPASATISPALSPLDAELYEDISNSSMRKVIGKRLLESKSTIPHYYLTVEVKVDNLLKLRSELNKKLEEKGVKLSVNDFIIKASAAALKAVPTVNSSWTDEFVRQYKYVDISVAVSTDAGLITPIVVDADKRGLADISSKVKELAGKARSNQLKPQEFQGGTFTISNLGMFGVNQFAAIVNPPQAAILAVGTTVQKVVPALASSEKEFEVANMLTVTLSCDHRVVDGAVGAQWLAEFKKFMEDPTLLLL